MKLQRNFLVVEDDIDTGQMIATFLTRNGNKARTVSNRSDALREMRQCSYDHLLWTCLCRALTLAEFMTTALSFKSTNIILISAVADVARVSQSLGLKRCDAKYPAAVSAAPLGVAKTQLFR
jgi:two-component SAPR family response regulator